MRNAICTTWTYPCSSRKFCKPSSLLLSWKFSYLVFRNVWKEPNKYFFLSWLTQLSGGAMWQTGCSLWSDTVRSDPAWCLRSWLPDRRHWMYRSPCGVCWIVRSCPTIHPKEYFATAIYALVKSERNDDITDLFTLSSGFFLLLKHCKTLKLEFFVPLGQAKTDSSALPIRL